MQSGKKVLTYQKNLMPSSLEQKWRQQVLFLEISTYPPNYTALHTRTTTVSQSA